MRRGVADYLSKPIEVPRLRAILSNVARTRNLRLEVETLRDELRRLGRFGQLIGASSTMQKIYDAMARVAPTDATVFVVASSVVEIPSLGTVGLAALAMLLALAALAMLRGRVG